MRRRFPLLALALLALALAPTAAAAVDLARGETLANRWCASCHLVSPTQTRATPDAPSFAAIARRPDAPPLETYLAVTHTRMPDMALTRDEITDLSAYIRASAP
ncbi:MAG: cytochrome c [Rhizobiales bacterium]|nr:cytochrome c [Hyphomicrobiales bacterium]